MFTGIVQGMAVVHGVECVAHRLRLAVALPGHLRNALAIGASVAVDGVCLTVTGWDDDAVHFDVVEETLQRTSLGQRVAGDRVNVERSVRQGDEIGGHLLSGHVDGVATLVAVTRQEDLQRVRYVPPAALMKYLLMKGFVALNGCSLTIAAVDPEAGWFEVAYIPETLRATNHGLLAVGDVVNLEVDRQTQAIVETVERVLAANPRFMA